KHADADGVRSFDAPQGAGGDGAPGYVHERRIVGTPMDQIDHAVVAEVQRVADEFLDRLVVRVADEESEEAIEESVAEGVAGGFERAESATDGRATYESVQNVFVFGIADHDDD